MPPFFRVCSVLTYGLWVLLASPILGVDVVFSRVGLLALPCSLPAAPVPAVLNPHREVFVVAGLAKSLMGSTLVSEKNILYSPWSFLYVLLKNICVF